MYLGLGNFGPGSEQKVPALDREACLWLAVNQYYALRIPVLSFKFCSFLRLMFYYVPGNGTVIHRIEFVPHEIRKQQCLRR
jgi:hypothetical protein